MSVPKENAKEIAKENATENATEIAKENVKENANVVDKELLGLMIDPYRNVRFVEWNWGLSTACANLRKK